MMNLNRSSLTANVGGWCIRGIFDAALGHTGVSTTSHKTDTTIHRPQKLAMGKNGYDGTSTASRSLRPLVACLLILLTAQAQQVRWPLPSPLAAAMYRIRLDQLGGIRPAASYY